VLSPKRFPRSTTSEFCHIAVVSAHANSTLLIRLSDGAVIIGLVVSSSELVVLPMRILETSSIPTAVTGGGRLGAVSAGDSVIIDTSSVFSILITGGVLIVASGSVTGGLSPWIPDGSDPELPDDPDPELMSDVGFLRRSSKSHIYTKELKKYYSYRNILFYNMQISEEFLLFLEWRDS